MGDTQLAIQFAKYLLVCFVVIVVAVFAFAIFLSFDFRFRVFFFCFFFFFIRNSYIAHLVRQVRITWHNILSYKYGRLQTYTLSNNKYMLCMFSVLWPKFYYAKLQYWACYSFMCSAFVAVLLTSICFFLFHFFFR